MNDAEAHRPPNSKGRLFLLGGLLVALYFAFRLLQPFLDAFIMAIVLGSLVYPVYEWIRRRLRGRRNLASFLTCLLVAIILLGPVALIISQLVDQALQTFEWVNEWVDSGGVNRLMDQPVVVKARGYADRYLDLNDGDLRQEIETNARGVGQFLLSKTGSILTGTGNLMLEFLVMMFVLFYVLRNGRSWLETVQHLSPLPRSHEEKLLQRVRKMSRSAIVGAFGTGAAQAVVAGIGFLIAGIPAIFWGVMVGVASFLPAVGTFAITGPATLYLFLTGQYGRGIFLGIYSVVVVGSVDNILRPMLVGGSEKMPFIWLFFSILGGIQYFGMLGVIYGPLVFALVAVLLYLYELEFGDYLKTQDVE